MINKQMNFLDKPWHVQALIFGLVAFMLCAGFWYFVTRDTRAETAQLKEQIDALQQANAKAQVASQRINDFRAAHSRVQADYDELVTLLPEQRELTNVLQGIQDRARGHLSVRRFSPKEDFQENFYSGKPIEVEVSGTYNKLGIFFAQMAAYQRLVSISDFSILKTSDQKGGRTVEGQFLLTAYYVSSEKLQEAAAAPAAAPAGKGEKAKPAAAAKKAID